MKECFKCLETKPLSEFYKHSGMSGGYMGKCKECTKADVRKHRAENLERIQAYDRQRGSLPHRVAARAEYSKTEAYEISHAKSLAKYKVNHKDRRDAQVAVGNAVRDGRLIPWPVCSIPECECKPEAHHPDYSAPLDVVWLCDKHHKEAHKLGREIERNRI